ncbi:MULTISPECIES: ABC transporter ATP-binding protein [Bacillaceae]|uniref:ABC transporter ATP-binding protein n=2 Tax=Bacillaceae TaxID=186817 RepID=A0A7V7RJ48_9BACI|nr:MULTISPECIES: dipeptide/oligopeptide/nickel ABC transporter ATP-binding protein [Bacillaceae]KAB2330672.1 ABC transporter ATP-binding protein [Bacillus mesophilum]QVY61813.1 ABC transporter ATP-binding protein [Cytobacillus gottheilii]
MNLLSVKDLVKSYNGINAVDHISFDLKKGECLGLVGESGCGKSTLSRCLLRLESVDAGSITFKDKEIQNLSQSQLRPIRKDIQIIFQNPTAALNPRLKIKDSILDPYLQYQKELSLTHFSFTSKDQYVNQLLEAVGLPKGMGDRYPHEISGGQRQRVTIARAISIEPEMLILDEPTASLDVITQAEVLALLAELRQQLQLSYLFISHDLTAVNQLSQQIMVMKKGKIVDQFPVSQLFSEDRHSYTKELIEIF